MQSRKGRLNLVTLQERGQLGTLFSLKADKKCWRSDNVPWSKFYAAKYASPFFLFIEYCSGSLAFLSPLATVTLESEKKESKSGDFLFHEGQEKGRESTENTRVCRPKAVI